MDKNISSEDKIEDFSSELSLLQDVDIPVIGGSGEVIMLSNDDSLSNSDTTSVFSSSSPSGSAPISEVVPVKKAPPVPQKVVKVAEDPEIVTRSQDVSMSNPLKTNPFPKKTAPTVNTKSVLPKKEIKKPVRSVVSADELKAKVISPPIFPAKDFVEKVSEKKSIEKKEEGVNIDEYVRSQVSAYIETARGIDEKHSIQTELEKQREESRRKREMASKNSPAQPITPSNVASPNKDTSVKEEKDHIESSIKNIIKQHSLSFEDAVVESRFFTLARSRFRDIRDKFELADAFVRPTKIGGLGMESVKANAVAEIIDSEALSYLGVQEMSQDSKSKIVAKVNQSKVAKTEVNNQGKYKAAILSKISSLQKNSPTPKKSLSSQIEPTKPTAPLRRQNVSLPHVVRPRIEPQGSSMDGVNAPQIKRSHVMSPLDELQKMDLENFRRLGVNADIRIQKIREKLDVLEKDSFSLRTQGVDAWKVSDVNRMYIQVGNDSISRGKSIAQIISEKEQKGEQILTSEEFNAVADLNASLRY